MIMYINVCCRRFCIGEKWNDDLLIVLYDMKINIWLLRDERGGGKVGDRD